MPTSPPLTNPEMTALTAGTGAVHFYATPADNVTVATATINQGSFTYPLAQLTITGTSGNWSAVGRGMSVAVGSTPGASDIGIYRVRKTPTSTILYIGETSAADPGLVTQSIRNATFSNGLYITVWLYRFDPFSIPPRFLSGNVIDEDYDLSVGTFNTTPECVINVTINGGHRWWGWVDAGQTYRTITLVATADLWVTSSSITTYLWIAPSSWTLVGGSISTNTVTYQVPAAPKAYTIQVALTDNNGITTYAWRDVAAHDTGANAPITISSLDSLTWDRTTMKASIVLNDKGLSNVTIGGKLAIWASGANIWYQNIWNGNQLDVPTAITEWVGWVTEYTAHTENGLRSATLNIEGVCGMMAKVGAYSQYFFAGSPANTWQTVITTLQYVDFWVYWMLRQRASGLIQQFNYTKLGISNLTGRLPQSKIPVSGSLLEQEKGLVQSYTANIGSDPDGTIQVRLHPNMTWGSRSAIVNRGTLDPSMYSISDIETTIFPDVRKVRGEGFYWDGAAAIPTPYLADAPGSAPGQGMREERLAGQFVDSQTDLNQKTALYYMMLNNPIKQTTLQFHGYWACFYPAQMELMTYTVSANLHPSGVAFTQNAIPISYSLKWDSQTGTVDGQMTVEGETNTNVTAITVPIPASLPTTPPISTSTGTSSTGTCSGTALNFTFQGDAALVIDATSIQFVTGMRSGKIFSVPLSVAGGISGGNGITQVLPDPFPSTNWWTTHTGAAPAYCLTDLGIFHIADIFNCTLSWTLYQSIGIDTTQFPALMRVSHAKSGDVYVWAFVPSTGNKRDAYRVTSSGIAWHVGLGGSLQFAPQSWSMDIDQHGADEMWVAYTGDAFNPNIWVYQILNGVATQKFAGFNWAFRGITMPRFIQKPQLTPSGLPNTSTSTPTILLGMAADIDRPCLVRSDDGFATYTDLSPTPRLTPGARISSMVAGDNPLILIESVVPTATVTNCSSGSGCSTAEGLWVSSNGGTSWSQAVGSNGANAGNTCGYFPTRINGQYQIYTGGSTSMGYMPAVNAALQTRTPVWTVATGGIRQVIPIS